nr:MAG TPA: hypothetical protein [Caudoviricetes sp.]
MVYYTRSKIARKERGFKSCYTICIKNYWCVW